MHFSSKEICTIIKTCNKAKIKELQLGDFKLTFRSKNEITPHPGPDEARICVEPKQEISDAVEAHLREELELRDNQVADLALEDPMRLEEMMANNELEPEDENGAFNGR